MKKESILPKVENSNFLKLKFLGKKRRIIELLWIRSKTQPRETKWDYTELCCNRTKTWSMKSNTRVSHESKLTEDQIELENQIKTGRSERPHKLKHGENITFEKQNLTSLNEFKQNVEGTLHGKTQDAKCKVVHGLKEQEPISNSNNRKVEEDGQSGGKKTTKDPRSPSFNSKSGN